MKKWNEVQYCRLKFEPPAVQELLKSFREIYANGFADLYVFEATDSSRFNAALREDLNGREYPFNCLIDSITLLNLAPELSPFVPQRQNIEYVSNGVNGFTGSIADTLLSGGAYKKFNGSQHDALRIASSFTGEIFNRFPPYCCFSIYGAWAKRFSDVAWDSTFVVCSAASSSWVLLCLSDTD